MTKITKICCTGDNERSMLSDAVKQKLLQSKLRQTRQQKGNGSPSMLHLRSTAVLVLLLLPLSSLQHADAAAGTALRSAAARTAASASSSSSTKSKPEEAGQFFGLTINLGNHGSLLGPIASVAGAVLGIQPAPAQPATPEPSPQQQPPKQSGAPAKAAAAGKQQQKVDTKKQKKQPKKGPPVVASAPAYVPQLPPGMVSMCEWRADFQECQVHRHYYLAVTQKPESYIAQTIVAASARDYACTAHTQPATCQDASQGLRCGWNLSDGRAWDRSGCRSYYLAEWTVFGHLIRAGLGPAQAAAGLTNLGVFNCPGSLSARALACNTAYPMDRFGTYNPALCAAAAPGCVFQPSSNNCILSPALTAQLSLLKPKDVGTCSASCYLRVLNACPAKPHRDHPAALQKPAGCWAKPGCTWASGKCGPDLYGSQLDKWGRKVAAAAEVCHSKKEAWGCGQAGAKGRLPLPPSAVQAALKRSVPGAGQQQAKCAV